MVKEGTPSLASLGAPPCYVALCGFDRQDGSEFIDALVIDENPHAVIKSIYENLTGELGSCESARLKAIVEAAHGLEFILRWDLSLQNLFDEKQMPLKVLKPLIYLEHWRKPLTEALLELKPSAQQIREILDLLCDLTLANKDLSWEGIAPQIKTEKQNSDNVSTWIKSLQAKRFPKTISRDDAQKEKTSQLSWPRGVHARWERQGDQAGIVIQTKISNALEWKRFKENLNKIEIDELFKLQ